MVAQFDNAECAAIVDRIAGVVGNAVTPVPLHEPDLGGLEWTYLKQCLETRQVSSIGAFVSRFEEALAAYTGARFAIATVNGTAALHAVLLLAGVGHDDEVLVPSLTFVAAANVTRYCGATPHFIDTDAGTLGPDAAKLSAYLEATADSRNGVLINRQNGRRIAALVVLHAFGHPAQLDQLVVVCRHFGLPLIEDAAQAIGSWSAASAGDPLRHAGTTGRAGVLSFNGNKILTTGGGGAILTDDPELAAQARHLTTTAKVAHPWAVGHDRVGYNYRMPNINAALGCAQLEQLPALLARKRRLAMRYQEAFAGAIGVRVVTEPRNARSNYWLNLLALDPDWQHGRDRLLAAAHAAGLLVRPTWTPLHQLTMFADCPRMDLDGAERLHAGIVSLPSSASLARDADPATSGGPMP